MSITPGLACGFETGQLPLSGLNAAWSVAAAASRGKGTYGLRGTTVPAAGGFSWPVTASGVQVCRFYVKPTVKPAGSYGFIGGFFFSTSPAGFLVIHTSGVFGITSGNGGTPVLSGVNPLTTQFYMIEMMFRGNDNPYTVDWKIDGVLQPRWTAPAGTDAGGDRFGFGDPTGTGLSFSADIDDVVTGTWTNADNDWFGHGTSQMVYPASDGTHSFTANDFSTGDAGTQQAQSFTGFWDMVNDPVPWTTVRSTTDNIAQRVARATGYVEIAPDSPDPRAANGCMAHMAYSASGTSADTAGCVVRNSEGTAATIFGGIPIAQGGLGGALADYSESTNFFKSVPVPIPAAGFTAAEVDAIRWRFGGSDDINPIPTVQALALELDFPLIGGERAVAPDRVPIGT